MQKKWFWVVIIFIGIGILFGISRVFAPKAGEVVEVGATEASGAGGAVEVEKATKAPEATEATVGLGASLPEGWREIVGDGFAIDVPLTWVATEEKNLETDSEKFSLRYFLASGQANDAYGDPDIVDLNIYALQKNNRTLAEVVNTFGKNEKEAETLVELMTKNANPPFNELTRDNIKISQSEIILNNGTVAKKIVFQCLKTCYLEGPAKTIVQYFIETPDSFFELTADTPTGEKTEVLLLVAEQVIKTFGVK